MIKFASSLCVLLFAFSPAVAQDGAIRVAKLNFSEVEHLVESVVLARPENTELADRFIADREKSNLLQKEIQEALMKGEKIDFKKSAFGAIGQSEDRKEMKALQEKCLLEVIEKVLGDKYHLVFKDSYSSSLIYSKIAIDDVTLLIKQDLLKQLPVKE